MFNRVKKSQYKPLATVAFLSLLSLGCQDKIKGQSSKESYSLEKQYSTYSIAAIKGCGRSSHENSSSIVLYDAAAGINRLEGWNHVKANREYASLKKTPTDYDVNDSRVVNDASCNDAPVHATTLIKKFGDYKRQHSNGIEPKLHGDAVEINRIESITIDMKLHSKGTFLPTPDLVQTRFGGLLTQAQYDELDHGKANFGITIFEEGFNDQSVLSLNAVTLVEIDPDVFFDRWVRITIPLSEMEIFTEKQYQRTPVTLEEFGERKIIGLRINPETRNSRVVRSYNGKAYENAVFEDGAAVGGVPAELFKEMSISIKRVSINLTQSKS